MTLNLLLSKVVSVNMQQENKIVIVPNPVKNNLSICFPQTNNYTAITIMDASGKLVYQKKINGSANSITLDVQRLASGWYLLRLNGKGTQQQAFLKQ